jgi:hypothetical protein
MPKFEVTIERDVPSCRERAVVVVEAKSEEDIEDYFDFSELDELDLDWEEVMEGHGGFPCDYDIYHINTADSSIETDIEL